MGYLDCFLVQEGNCLGNEHCGFKTWKKQRRVVKKCHSTQEEELIRAEEGLVFPGEGGWMEREMTDGDCSCFPLEIPNS